MLDDLPRHLGKQVSFTGGFFTCTECGAWMIAKLLNLLWVLLAVGIILVLTPLTFLKLYHGDLSMSALFALVLIPHYYFMLSVYFEHVLERRFHASPQHMPALQAFPLSAMHIVYYCRSRREVLRDVLDKLGTPGSFYHRLLSVHEALGWACIVEVIILVAWAVLRQIF
jgi:hypothetical protein